MLFSVSCLCEPPVDDDDDGEEEEEKTNTKIYIETNGECRQCVCAMYYTNYRVDVAVDERNLDAGTSSIKYFATNCFR